MQERLNIPPTKSALLAIKRQINFLDEGYRLLERKREMLTRLVYERLAEYKKEKQTVQAAIDESYHWLSITQMRMGSLRIKQFAIGMPEAVEVKVLPRRNLGIQYPSVSVKKLPLQPVSILGTDASLDETRIKFAEMVTKLAHLGEIEIVLWRLLEEQRKTQKRVNSLKYNVIPKYKRTVTFIESSLEEEERNTLFQIKVLREQSDAI